MQIDPPTQHKRPTRVPRLLLFPGLGIFYTLLFLGGEMRVPWLERVGLQFGELASLTPGKSIANLIEIPIVFLLGGAGAALLVWRPRCFHERFTLARAFVAAFYVGAILMYLLFPAIPE
jgi:hypothetical protein